MITYEIDVPFNIGDTVWIKERIPKYEEIECPFCHGNSTYDTGLYTYTLLKRDRMRVPWIVKCGTCDGRGILKNHADNVIKWYKATVKGVDEIHGSKCDIRYSVVYEDGTEHRAYEHQIFMKKPEQEVLS